MNNSELREYLSDAVHAFYSENEVNSQLFIQSLCKEGALLDGNGNRYDVTDMEQEALENKILSDINAGREIYIYSRFENYPRALTPSPDKKTLSLSVELLHEYAPDAVEEPGMIARFFDGILGMFGLRVDSCKQYEEYKADLEKFNKRQGLADKFNENRSNRDRQIRFRAKIDNIQDRIEAEFDTVKTNFTFEKGKDIENIPEHERDPEQRRIMSVYSKLDNPDAPSLSDKLLVIATADMNKIVTKEVAKQFFSPKAENADMISDLCSKCPEDDFARRSNISELVNADEATAYGRYMQFITAVANVQTKEIPQRLVQDMGLLRGIVAENIGNINSKLLSEGFEDATVVPAEKNALSGLAKVGEVVYENAQLTTFLARYLIQMGEHDPMMLAMYDRANAISSFTGLGSTALCSEAHFKDAYPSLSSLKGSLADNRSCDTSATKQIRDGISPELLTQCDEMTAKVSFSGDRLQAHVSIQGQSRQPAPAHTMQAEAPKAEMPKMPGM